MSSVEITTEPCGHDHSENRATIHRIQVKSSLHLVKDRQVDPSRQMLDI